MSDNLSNFFHMAGYAPYIWPAYGICALVLIIEALRSRKKAI